MPRLRGLEPDASREACSTTGMPFNQSPGESNALNEARSSRHGRGCHVIDGTAGAAYRLSGTSLPPYDGTSEIRHDREGCDARPTRMGFGPSSNDVRGDRY